MNDYSIFYQQLLWQPLKKCKKLFFRGEGSGKLLISQSNDCSFSATTKPNKGFSKLKTRRMNEVETAATTTSCRDSSGMAANNEN